MVEDLKRQASELYREQAKPIRTSESLSMKKLLYIAMAVVVLCLIVLQTFGGFKERTDPVVAASTPPTYAREAPPPELLEPAESPAAALETGSTAPPAETASREPERPAPAPAATPPPAAKTDRPALKRDVAAPVPAAKEKKAAAASKPEAVEPAKAAPAPPPAPEISPVEMARRELARDVVLEKSPAFAKIWYPAGERSWQAEPRGQETYQVSFSVHDGSTGSQAQYVWRVDLSARTIAPLSYYARRLP